MKLTEGYTALALKLQEQDELSHNDLYRWLCDAAEEAGCCLCDFYGDSESGDAIVSCQGDLKRVPYEIIQANGASTASLDMDQCEDVLPVTSYVPEADEADHYASMESAKLYAKVPAFERFVSKDERDAADAGSFAGKGKSFPILKPQDVKAAVSSMGRAGSDNYDTGTLKRNIIRIAKKKGWTKYLPKAWQGSSDSSEARRQSTQAATNPGSLRLTESALTLENIVLKESRADYPIKLIAPGAGSSAFYPREVLQRDGPRVFKQGTHVYLNHPTQAEEAQRPEGDVANLAGVLTTDAKYQENGPKGAGLYARMKVFADHAQMVEEKAAHVGMSIRASGVAESGRMRDGLPVLKELTSAESVDVVTKAGAGGMILTEAARPQSQDGGQDVTLEEAKKMIAAEVAPFRQRALRADAKDEAMRVLEVLTLPAQAKARIIERVLENDIPEKDGGVDFEKLREALVKESKREGEYLASLSNSGRVVNMGGGDRQVDTKEAKKEKKALKEAIKADEAIFQELGLSETAAKFAVRGNAA